ncbi:MAG: D-alanyl-D-alanine carboxypeptidase, partial [Myxococcota bacterium]
MIWGIATALATPLDKAIDRALSDPALAGASAGVAVYDAGGGARLGFDAERRLVPASTSKWITAAAAVRDLGLEHQFRTRIGARGYTEGADLVGDVVIVGGGDPSLGDPDPTAVVQQVVDAVRAGEIARIRGSVVVDASASAGPALGPGWMWDDLSAPYSPPYGALNIGHNLLREGWACEA